MRTDKEIIETIAELESKLANPRMAIPENASGRLSKSGRDSKE